MSFVKKEWKDRIAEYINRRRLTHEDGSTELVEVARDEGNISQEGDAFNAETMNDLEERIAEALKPLDTMEEIEANTQPNQLAGAGALKELSQSTEDDLKNILKKLSEYLPLIGGKLTGKLQVGDNVEIESSGEGGNIRIKSPDDTWWEIDCLNNTEMRIFGDGTCEKAIILGRNGDIRVSGEVQDGNGNKLSDIGITVAVANVEIGNTHTSVIASLGMVRLSATVAIITINYRIESNDGSTTCYRFIDKEKIKAALGLSKLEFAPMLTNVTFKPSAQLSGETLTTNTSLSAADEQGYTGIMFSAVGEFGRVYNENGNFGGWPLSSNLYKVGTYGTIVINGATIA